MNQYSLRNRLRTLTLGAALLAAATGCQRDESSPFTPRPDAGDLSVALAVSSRTAAVGDRIAVAVDVTPNTMKPLIGLQGAVRFDPARLTYLGQSDESGFAIVNPQASATGSLRVASLNTSGLTGRTAVFVFEVKNADYVRGMTYNMEGAATSDLARVHRYDAMVVDAADLAVPANPKSLTLQDWRVKFTPEGQAVPGERPLRNPGEIVANLKYGDATLDGAVDIVGDAFYIANVSVGNSQMISGTDSPDRDAVVAGNVDPFNGSGLGEPNDPLPPGVETNGSRLITIFDAAAIASEAVNPLPSASNPPVVGEIIPGRAAASPTTQTLTGNITADLTLTSDKVWIIDGTVFVGATAEPCATRPILTIQPGTRIEGQTTNAGTLVINRCGKIDAQGTFLQPITFSCTGTKGKGCWGGLVINGNAPLNNGTTTSPANNGIAGGCLEAAGEGSTGLYGGCDPHDNSGTLKYVVVEYAGTIFSATNERNGITFQAVGDGTTVDFVQSHGSKDDAMEFFGGTVNVKHLVLTAPEDDSFDWVGGYDGRAQYVIVQTCQTTGCDRGIEADNFGIDAGDPEAMTSAGGGLAAHRSEPMLYNFTIVGRTTAGQLAGQIGMLLRQNTGGFFRNFVLYGSAVGLDIDQPTGAAGSGLNFSTAICNVIATGDAAGDNTPAVTGRGLSFRYALITGALANGSTDTGDPPVDVDPAPPADPGPPYTCGAYTHTGADLEAQYIARAANHIVTNVALTGVMVDPQNVFTPDFRPVSGGPITTTTATATPTGDAFFDPAGGSFVGAVGVGAAVPWFSGWTRGWQNATTP